ESRPGPVSHAALTAARKPSAHVAVVEPAPERVAEHEVPGRLVRRREPVLAQQRHQRGGEDHLALRAGRLQLLRNAAAGELLADVEQTRVEVDVAPAEPECLADAEAAVGQEREEDAVGAGVGDEASEVALVEDADLPRTALRLLARLQARDGAGAHPAAPHG